MITVIRNKIRALIEDLSTVYRETFTYTSSPVFTITADNPTVLSVLKNGIELATNKWSFSSSTNQLTISDTLVSGDVIQATCNTYKYSDSELDEYIKAALVWISVYSYDFRDYEIESGDIIVPTPDNKTTDLIALVASIVIKPDYSNYSLPNVKIVYPKKMTKEERIEKLINKYNYGLGICELIVFDVT